MPDKEGSSGIAAGSRTCGFDPLRISKGGVRKHLNGAGCDRVLAGSTEAPGRAVISYGWAQLKLAASSRLPAPEYFATCG